MGVIISIINNKGGTSKSTTTVSLGQALAREGKKVLIVDNDTQGNASTLLLEKGYKPTMYDLYSLGEKIDENEDKKIDITNFVYFVDYQENLFIIPNDLTTSTIEPTLINNSSVNVLKDSLKDYLNQNNFDYCIIDNPPNMGIFVLNSLYTSDCVIVPTDAGSKASLGGLSRAIKFINEVKEKSNPNLKFLRVLLTKVDKRTSVSKVIVDNLQKSFGVSKMFENMIPINTDIQKAELKDKTIFRYNTKSAGAKSYRLVAKELIKITKSLGY